MKIIFAGSLLREIRENYAALISSHVAGLTSHASIFIQLKKFSIKFTSGDCRGHSILRLSFLEPCPHRHGSVAMSIVLLEQKWVMVISKHLLYWLQQISIHDVNV